MSNPLWELLHSGGAHLSPLQGAALATGAVAALGAVSGLNAMQGRQQTNQSYTQMLKRFPELARENPSRVRELFTSIANAAPDVARDHVVAGSLIKRMINYDGVDHATYMELVKTQESMTKTRSNQFTPFFQTADVSSRLLVPFLGIPNRPYSST